MAAPQAEARDGCGRGWFYNGRACVQEEAGPRYFNDAPVYAPERNYYRSAPRAYGPPRPIMGDNGTISCGNPNYTWHDGAEPWPPGERELFLRIVPHRVTGRRIQPA